MYPVELYQLKYKRSVEKNSRWKGKHNFIPWILVVIPFILLVFFFFFNLIVVVIASWPRLIFRFREGVLIQAEIKLIATNSNFERISWDFS